MFKLSEIISRPVISLYEGLKLGYVKNACLDEKIKKIKGFIIFDDESDGVEKYIALENVFKIGDDAILLKNTDKLTGKFVEENSPMNLSAYSTDGEYAGEINDINLNDSLEIVSLSTNKGVEITQNKLFRPCENVLVFLGEKEIKISSLKPKGSKINGELENIKVNILELKEFSEEENEKQKTITVPSRITSDFNFMIGRKAAKTILGYGNEVLIKKGQTITEKTVALIKSHGKINELILNADLF